MLEMLAVFARDSGEFGRSCVREQSVLRRGGTEDGGQNVATGAAPKKFLSRRVRTPGCKHTTARFIAKLQPCAHTHFAHPSP